MIMIKCSPEAFARCQTKCHHCRTEAEAYFLEGSDCDKFNQEVLAAPKTNGDRIRAMSDEELADWIARTQVSNVAEVLETIGFEWEQPSNLKEGVKKECLEWLKQPAEVE